MSARLDALLLCDFAQIREGLLFVQSGGLTRLAAPSCSTGKRRPLARSGSLDGGEPPSGPLVAAPGAVGAKHEMR